jgi:hypothetical protein
VELLGHILEEMDFLAKYCAVVGIETLMADGTCLAPDQSFLNLPQNVFRLCSPETFDFIYPSMGHGKKE